MALDFLKKLTAGLGPVKVAEFRWRAPSRLDRGLVQGLSFGMDRRGRGLSVWENAGMIWTQSVGPAFREEQVSLPLGEGTAPCIATNLGGRGVAIWVVDDKILERAIVGLPLNLAVDSAPSSRSLFKTTGEIRNVQVVVDRRGSALAVWSHGFEGNWEILAKVFDLRAQAWEEEPQRLGPVVDYPLEPRLAMNRKGSAIVLWKEEARDTETLVASFFLPSEKVWSDQPVTVASGMIKDHQVAIDFAGNSMVLWVSQEYRQRASLQAKMFSMRSLEWSQSRLLATAERFHQLQLAMTGTGEALAIWLQSEGSTLAFLHSKAYRAGAWEPAVTRLDSEGGKVVAFFMALGAKGQAGIFYFLHGPQGTAPFVRTRDKDWGSPMQIGSHSERSLSHPLLALCPEGIVAHWQWGAHGQVQIFKAVAEAGVRSSS